MFLFLQMQLSREKTTLSQFWGFSSLFEMLQMSKKSKLSRATTSAGCSLNKLLRNSIFEKYFLPFLCKKVRENRCQSTAQNRSQFLQHFYGEQHFPTTFPSSPPSLALSCLAQKHHSSFAAGKGVSTVRY